MFELDVKEMYPSMKREEIMHALKDLYHLYLKHRKKRTPGGLLQFALHKQNKKLDHLGVGNPALYNNI